MSYQDLSNYLVGLFLGGLGFFNSWKLEARQITDTNNERIGFLPKDLNHTKILKNLNDSKKNPGLHFKLLLNLTLKIRLLKEKNNQISEIKIRFLK